MFKLKCYYHTMSLAKDQIYCTNRLRQHKPSLVFKYYS